MYEIALVSSSKARLETLSQKGNRVATQVLRLLGSPERVLSTIQVGITLVGIVSGAFGGVALADDLVPLLKNIPVLAEHAQDVAFVIIVATITYFSLIVGELVPKSIALNNPEKIALFLTPFIKVISVIAFPFVWFLSLSTRTVNGLIGLQGDNDQKLTQDELKFYVRKSREQGVINKEESRMLSEVLRFVNKRASDIMTHRKEVVCTPLNADRDEVLNTVQEKQFSKYVVYGKDNQDVHGVVATKNLLTEVQKPDFNLANAVEPALFIPENLLINKVLEMFRKNRKNFGVVVDEYGSMEGIITLHDITEAVLGDFPEETEEAHQYIQSRKDGSYLVDASIPIDFFMDEMSVYAYDDISHIDFNTLGGLCMHFLNKVPEEGDGFKYRDMLFKIEKMDGSRVKYVTVKRLGE